MTFGRSTVFVFVICMISALASQQAFAAPDSVTVRFGDIDQHSAEGARVLLGRISRAARIVCGHDASSPHAAVQRAYRRCTRDTMADAVERTGNQTLRAEFLARYGRA